MTYSVGLLCGLNPLIPEKWLKLGPIISQNSACSTSRSPDLPVRRWRRLREVGQLPKVTKLGNERLQVRSQARMGLQKPYS